MKLGTLICSVALCASMAVGVGVAVGASNQTIEAKATTTFNAGTKIYLDATGITGATLNAWVWYTSGSHWETFDYDSLSGYYMITLDSAATALTLARCDQRAKENGTAWSDGGTVYNEGNVDFETGKNWIYFISYSGNKMNLGSKYITYHIGGSFNNWNMTTDTYKMADGADDSGNHQGYISYTSTADNVVFKAVANYNGTVPGSNYYGTLAEGVNHDYITNDDDGNVKLIHAGTYEIYLKADRTLWVQVASATEAETWSKGFVQGVGCATSLSTGNAPANWSTYAGTYAGLTDGAKNVMYGTTGSNAQGATYTEQAAFIYDMCVRKYQSCANNRFMVNSGGTPRAANINAISLLSNNESSTFALITLIAGLVGISAIGTFVFFRKRRQES